MKRQRPVDYSLYYVLDVPMPHDPVAMARAAVAGGATVVQVRGKLLTGRALYELVTAVRDALADTGVPVIVDDRVDVALAAGAAGVHIGREDIPFVQARAIAPDLIIGVSCYGDLDRAAQAVAAGVDYIAFGAFFPSTTKPEAVVVPRSVLAGARQFGLPVVAIGGITVERVPELLDSGADGVAVVSAIQGTTDPEAAARAFRTATQRFTVRGE